MPRNRGWFRVYDRMIDSPQIMELDDSEFRLIVSMWALASAAGTEDGFVPYTVPALRRRAMPDHTPEELQKMLAHLCNLDLIAACEDGTWQIRRWPQHQWQYDSKRPSYRRDEDEPGSDGEQLGKASGSDGEANGKIEAEEDTDKEPDTDISPSTSPVVLPEESPDLTPTERQALHELKRTDGYRFDFKVDLELIRKLLTDFPNIDLLTEIKKWQTYRVDNPKWGRKSPRLALRNWCEKAANGFSERRHGARGTPRQRPGRDTAPPKPTSKYDVLLKRPNTQASARSDGGRGPPA